MQFEWTHSLQNIDTIEWDKDLGEEYILHQSNFLKVLEQSKINKSQLYFFRAYENKQLACSAVVSVFEMDLDLFIQENLFVKIVKKLFPNLFKIKLIFCGTPVSAGHQNIWIKDINNERHLDLCLAEINQKMHAIAKQEKIKFSAFKEFDPLQSDIFEPFLQKYGYVRCWSLPTVNLHIKDFDTENYWKSLSNQQRRQINRSLKKIDFTFQDLAFHTPSKQKVYFTLQSLPESSSVEFYEKYIFVMQRAKVKFETLNQAFFDEFFQRVPEGKLLSLEKDGQIIASFLLIEQEKSITFLFVSKKDYQDKYDSYFNLLTMLVKYAVERKKQILQLGQTTYYTKIRVGGKVSNLFLFFKGNYGIWRFLINKYSHILFPKY
ncbi:MAG: hypothetical protein MUC49_17360 [Raineya sp.]|jgi:hypothetical protein|nr:hypothetical protein [Raineya sp.]